MNDMKKDRLKFRTIGAYMSVVYVLIGLLTVAAIFCAWMIGFDSLLILLFAVLYLIAILMGIVFYLLPENKTVIVTSDEMGYPFIAGSIRMFILRGIRIFTLVHICSKKTLRQCLILTAMRL